MNQENLDDQKLIERYLLHQLDEQEQLSFTLELLRNPQLRDKVEAHRLILNTIKTIEVPTTTYRNPWPKRLLFLFVIFLLIGAYFFLNSLSKTEEVLSEEVYTKPLKEEVDRKIDQADSLMINPTPVLEPSTKKSSFLNNSLKLIHQLN